MNSEKLWKNGNFYVQKLWKVVEFCTWRKFVSFEWALSTCKFEVWLFIHGSIYFSIHRRTIDHFPGPTHRLSIISSDGKAGENFGSIDDSYTLSKDSYCVLSLTSPPYLRLPARARHFISVFCRFHRLSASTIMIKTAIFKSTTLDFLSRFKAVFKVLYSNAYFPSYCLQRLESLNQSIYSIIIPLLKIRTLWSFPW